MELYICNLKRIALLILVVFPLVIFANSPWKGIIQQSYCINNYWGEWKSEYVQLITTSNDNYVSTACSESYNHPSEYYWRFCYDKNSSYMNGEWTVYKGSFEYYVDAQFPTIEEAMKRGLWVNSDSKNNVQKKVVNATIQLKKTSRTKSRQVGYNVWGNPKYENYQITQYVYNIFFDNVGYAIQIN